LLAELHDHDVIRLADNGNIRAAYPFSAVPTTHVLTIDGGAAVFSMCAIDALGMAAMLGRDITIESRDPYTGQAITVTIHNGHTSWVPSTAVVFVGAQATDVQNCCPPDGGTPHCGGRHMLLRNELLRRHGKCARLVAGRLDRVRAHPQPAAGAATG